MDGWTLAALCLGFVLGLAASALLRSAGATGQREALIQREGFERGRAAGVAEERERLVVRVQPFHSKESQLLGLKTAMRAGYSQQIHYNGLPIGEPQVVVTHLETMWDEERVKQVLQIAGEVAATYVKELAVAGVKAQLR